MRARVYIATTSGPSEVQLICEELEGVRSAAYVGLGSEELGISKSYNAFVARSSGVVGRATGHSSYRLCLSHAVDVGSSWQLGVYLAHLLKTKGSLYEALAPDGAEGREDRAIWATGEVDYLLSVSRVDEIDRKIAASEPLFDDLVRREVPLTIVVAEGQLDAAHKSLLKSKLKIMPKWRLVELSTLDGIEDVAGLAEGAPVAEPPQPAPAPKRRAKTGLAVAAAVLLALVAGGVVFADRLEPYLAYLDLDQGSQQTSLSEPEDIPEVVADPPLPEPEETPPATTVDAGHEAPTPPPPPDPGVEPENGVTPATLAFALALERLVDSRSCFAMRALKGDKPPRDHKPIDWRGTADLVLAAPAETCRLTLEILNRGSSGLQVAVFAPPSARGTRALEPSFSRVAPGDSASFELLNRYRAGAMDKDPASPVTIALAFGEEPLLGEFYDIDSLKPEAIARLGAKVIEVHTRLDRKNEP